ncbi:hypothetical protein GGH99_007150, partial [Coemansia sp. RSA 1285]
MNSAILFRHAKQAHGFDFFKVRADNELDFYQCMRLVNYIRTKEINDPDPANGATPAFAVDGTEAFLSDDAYLKPTLAEDALLYALDELDLDDSISVASSCTGRSDGAAAADTPKERKLMGRIKELEQQLTMRERE